MVRAECMGVCGFRTGHRAEICTVVRMNSADILGGIQDFVPKPGSSAERRRLMARGQLSDQRVQGLWFHAP